MVELLVVIAIISLLASILVPSLKRAVESARTTACAMNLNQIGLAFNIYTCEFNGWMIPAQYGPVNNGPDIPFDGFWRRSSTFMGYLGLEPNPGNRNSVVVCPSDLNVESRFETAEALWGPGCFGRVSYQENIYLGRCELWAAGPPDTGYRRISSVISPANTICFGDCDFRYCLHPSLLNGGWVEGFYRHSGGNDAVGWNVLYADGCVSLEDEAIEQDSYPYIPSFRGL